MRYEINVLSMMHEYGAEGYGFYLTLLEMMAETPTLTLPLSLEVKEMPKGFIESCVDAGLFMVKGSQFYAPDIRFYNTPIAGQRMYEINVKRWYAIRNRVFVRDNYTCTYCGKVGGKLEADHIIPVSAGGTDELKNLTTACRRCNRQKKDKSVNEFLAWREANAKQDHKRINLHQ